MGEPPEATRLPSAYGQAMEFAVWRELIQQSGGLLHVFLPLLDSGLDAVIHRLTDQQYIPVQVKSRDRLTRGKVQIVVREDSLVDDRALIIAGLLTDEGLGDTLLVVGEGTFRTLAAAEVIEGVEVYEAEFSMRPTDATRWRPYLVPRAGLGARLLGSARAGAGPSLVPSDRHRSWLGFLGESEVIRRLAENSQLDLFRPFPDLEMVEVLARNNLNGGFTGLQVKTGIPGADGKAHLRIRKATVVPAASTYVVGLAWLPDLNRFAGECLVIPTEHLSEVATDGVETLDLYFHPESPEKTALDPYRTRLAGLGAAVGRAGVAPGVQW